MSTIDWGTDKRLLCSECAGMDKEIFLKLPHDVFHHCIHIEAACVSFNLAEMTRTRGDRKGIMIPFIILALSIGYFIGRLVS